MLGLPLGEWGLGHRPSTTSRVCTFLPYPLVYVPFLLYPLVYVPFLWLYALLYAPFLLYPFVYTPLFTVSYRICTFFIIICSPICTFFTVSSRIYTFIYCILSYMYLFMTIPSRTYVYLLCVCHRSFYDKLRAGQEDDLDGAELAESDDESSGPKGLTVWQLAKVLKPYFWPKWEALNFVDHAWPCGTAASLCMLCSNSAVW